MSLRRFSAWSKAKGNQDEDNTQTKDKETIKESRTNSRIYEPKRIEIGSFSSITETRKRIEAEQAQRRPQPPKKEDLPKEDPEEIEAESLLNELRNNRIKKNKSKRICLSIAVSEDDELIFRAAAAEADMTVSAWARKAMYKLAKVKPPKRKRK